MAHSEEKRMSKEVAPGYANYNLKKAMTTHTQPSGDESRQTLEIIRVF